VVNPGSASPNLTLHVPNELAQALDRSGAGQRRLAVRDKRRNSADPEGLRGARRRLY
jgi:hypothetical protein